MAYYLLLHLRHPTRLEKSFFQLNELFFFSFFLFLLRLQYSSKLGLFFLSLSPRLFSFHFCLLSTHLSNKEVFSIPDIAANSSSCLLCYRVQVVVAVGLNERKRETFIYLFFCRERGFFFIELRPRFHFLLFLPLVSDCNADGRSTSSPSFRPQSSEDIAEAAAVTPPGVEPAKFASFGQTIEEPLLLVESR